MALGLDSLWGDPDLGPIAFETLRRRNSPNDALACVPDLCPAKADIVSPIFEGPPRALRRTMREALASERGLTLVHADDPALTDRYVQRTALLGFPDTIVVRFVARPRDRSTVLIYSRSKLGWSDLGANRARVGRWLSRLGERAGIAR